MANRGSIIRFESQQFAQEEASVETEKVAQQKEQKGERKEELKVASEGNLADEYEDNKEEEKRYYKMQENLKERKEFNAKILALICDERFRNMYMTDGSSNFPRAFVMANLVCEKLNIEIMARCPKDQNDAILEEFTIRSHEYFENKITEYTKSSEKPNPHLVKCKNWDVGIYFSMKIEYATEKSIKRFTVYTLRREAGILEHLWVEHAKLNADLDEMTGIPMFFDFAESLDPQCILGPVVDNLNEVDIFGELIPVQINDEKKRSCFCYMSSERLGPSVSYLMQLIAAVPGKVGILSFDSAFKIFDQLICRLLQIHRLKTIHCDISPENIYFGRNDLANAVYLSNFGAATVLKDKSQLHMPMLGSRRFASISALYGNQKHPYQDIQSAFYALLAMICLKLPWDDNYDLIKGQNEYAKMNQTGFKKASTVVITSENNTNNYAVQDQDSNGSNPSSLQDIVKDTAEELGTPELAAKYTRAREIKDEFWEDEVSGIRRLCSAMETQHKHSMVPEDSSRTTLVFDILTDIYKIVQTLVSKEKTITCDEAMEHCRGLNTLTSDETNVYFDIRRCILRFFQFDPTGYCLYNTTFKKLLEKRGETKQLPTWDLSNWCFKAIKMRRSYEHQPGKSGAIIVQRKFPIFKQTEQV